MGPDARISAPHDAGTPTGENPRWTLIYDAWKTKLANPSIALTPASRVPKFRTWLVTNAGGTGPVVSLVGPASLGANYATKDLVSAPLMDVSDSSKNGKIAWWTADESTKAKINAGAAVDQFAAASKPFFDAQSPPRVGSQAIPELSAFEWKPKQRAAVITTDSVNLAAGLNSHLILNFLLLREACRSERGNSKEAVFVRLLRCSSQSCTSALKWWRGRRKTIVRLN